MFVIAKIFAKKIDKKFPFPENTEKFGESNYICFENTANIFKLPKYFTKYLRKQIYLRKCAKISCPQKNITS